MCTSRALARTRKTIIASSNRRMTPWCASTLATCALIVGAQIEAMNVLYEQMWIYSNLFQPVMHLSEKTVIGDKVRRKWDQARTPFERLKATGKLSAQQEQHLQTLYEQTNPRNLREAIYQGLAQLWSQSMTSATEVA